MGGGAEPHSLLHRSLTAVDRAPQFLRSDPGGLDRPGWIAADREPALLPAESVVEHEGAPALVLVDSRFRREPHGEARDLGVKNDPQIGRASCRERVCQYV